MATNNQLCEHCLKVPLDMKTLRDLPFGSRWSLGKAGDVLKRTCPLCRVISLALYESARVERRDVNIDSDAILGWGSRYPGSRRMFSINTLGVGICVVRMPGLDCPLPLEDCLLPNLGRAVDKRRIKGWVDHCAESHGARCNPEPHIKLGSPVVESYAGLELLRFIDVQQKCIVETRTVCRYVAISYVWGVGPNFRLKTSNLADLMKPDALSKKENWDRIPRTIRNAIALVRGIGETYLWCDALCLIQNDAADLSQGVNAMDSVYENAAFTIVAAYGHDANSGLPGVEEGTRFNGRSPEIIPGVYLDVHMTLNVAMRHSVYRSRAWTFQEESLSRRKVYFVESKIYFECPSTTRLEFYPPELDRGTDPVDIRETQTVPRWNINLENFREVLVTYTQRFLSYDQDALRAMAGILRRWSDKMKCQFLEGLPTAVFDEFLLFRAGNHDGFPRRRGFPSYSWAGWRGPISRVKYYPYLEGNRWLEENTWIVWYRTDPGGTTKLVWDLDPAANPGFPFDDPRYVGYRTRRPFQSPAVLPFATDRTEPTLIIPSTTRSYTILQFWTLSLFFNISIFDRSNGLSLISDGPGKICGFFYLDNPDNTAFLDSSTGPFEVIVLSSMPEFPYEWIETLRPILQARGEKDDFESQRYCYNIMILEWLGDGIAERRGLGFILPTAIVNGLTPGPAWKEIVLG
ncbi:heterokaryon incompatibility protein-domain-containing protein [Bombardia bombarda]|uniref:Heterokaryon incompatibility protein-domain-containing protein n=1 Tax=Bombardia bombarda TaxID=252184 RepID=A0AA40CA22_9PEZI|nr:heterokaryon incompatibility protein-domain-containing protein [Bombardia bombarda]